MKATQVKFASIDDYIATFPEDIQKKLEELRATVHAAAPGAEEKISYHMPGFALNGNLVYFAAFKNHIGFFGGSDAGSEAYKNELARYAGPKGSLKFPYDKPLPLKLIRRIVKIRVAENNKKVRLKASGAT